MAHNKQVTKRVCSYHRSRDNLTRMLLPQIQRRIRLVRLVRLDPGVESVAVWSTGQEKDVWHMSHNARKGRLTYDPQCNKWSFVIWWNAETSHLLYDSQCLKMPFAIWSTLQEKAVSYISHNARKCCLPYEPHCKKRQFTIWATMEEKVVFCMSHIEIKCCLPYEPKCKARM